MNAMEAYAAPADLADAIREVLSASPEPLTLAKIRERLPAPYNDRKLQEVADVLQRQVAANVIVPCPKYRGSQDRYWDRPLREHAKITLRGALSNGALAWSDLRKKFPKYMRHLAESVLNEELAKGTIHRHPPASPRGGFRFALEPADLRPFALIQLEAALARLVERGFSLSDARAAFMHLLQESEWAEDAPSETALTVGAAPIDAASWNSPTY
jgi:hypothetical protein